MRKILKILTPENVYVEYELAGLGSRFAALILDHLIQGGILLLVLLGMGIGGVKFDRLEEPLEAYNSVVIAVGLILVFIVIAGYFIFFELLLNGQTPGKKVMKLRAVKENGEPINFFDSFLRNLLRTADMLPTLYLMGALFILFTKNYKRIGDFAANTVVIRVKKGERPVSLDSLLPQTWESSNEEERVNLYPVSNFEYGVLKEFMERKDHVGGRRPVFAFHLNKYFLKKFNLETSSYSDPYKFFEEILRMNSGI